MDEREKTFDTWLALHYDRIQTGEVFELPVVSGSMLPLLIPGASVKIRRIPFERCRAGDIIVIKKGFQVIAHRLLFRFVVGRRCYMLEKGDRNQVGGWIRGENVIGRVIAAQRADGSYLDLQTPEFRRRARWHVFIHILRNLFGQLRRVLGAVKRWLRNRIAGLSSILL